MVESLTIVEGINLSERFAEFFRSFKDEKGDYKYRARIARMALEGSLSLIVDFDDLLSFDPSLAERLVENPRLTIKASVDGLKEVMKVENAEYLTRVTDLFVRVRRLPESLKVPIRKARATHLGKLIAVEGIVTKLSPVKQLLLEAVYRCRECGEEVAVVQTGEKLEKPIQCPGCAAGGQKRGSFELVLEKCKFIDWQRFVLQERPEELPSGQLPRSIEVVASHDLVDIVRPGDRAVVTGILAVAPERSLKGQPPIFQMYLEANNVEVASKEDLDVEITPEDEKRILELSRRGDVRDLIVNSIAPSIYGYKEVKKAIALLLFGGVQKLHPDGVRVRGDVHILLIGDPGTAKSQLLRYVASIAPRGIYTSGKGSTAAGLTAAVVREKASGDFYLEAGALVIADGGIACIDEFDKMDPKDRVSIHEAMEQQTVSIAKAGIVATLNARASVLAAANPAFGRYLHGRPVTENIDLPPTILSRFDLIFVITDVPNAERDKALAEYVLDFHRQHYPESLEYVLPRDLLRKYIAYARRYVRPRLTEEAKAKLISFYVEMRSKSQGADSPIAITPRQLEALIRLAEAHAKMALNDVVTEKDAEAAIELMMVFLKSVGYDVETKTFDIDLVMTGQPKSQRDKVLQVIKLLREMVEEAGGEAVKREDFVARAVEKGLEEQFVRKVLERLYNSGEIIEPKPGYILLLRAG
ncbi:MAG: minichromosome maintenance protein MCM [Thermofilaceae archaeon]